MVAMKIDVFAICYNEEVMLPYFIRHYSQFASNITIFDNHSTDGTREILDRNRWISVCSYDSNNEIRDDIYLKIKNNCWKHSIADWVIVCDIDELVYFFKPLQNLENFTVVMPDWFEMVSDVLPIGEQQIYNQIHEGVCHGQTSKCIMFRPQALREINYDPGAHGINPVGDARVLHTSDAGILHYKYISPDYVARRHQEFGKRLSQVNRQNKWGVQYDFSTEQTLACWRNLWENRKNVL